MRGDTLAIRDRLLAVLKDADRPLITSEVCDRAGPYFEVMAHAEWRHDPRWHNQYVSLISCDGDLETVARHLTCAQMGYRQLRALEGQGLVARCRVPESRSVLWTAVASTTADELLLLEQMWEATS